jgi:hypothetical protein
MGAMARFSWRSEPNDRMVKFLVVMSLVTPVLLLSYRYGVRHTPIGRLLNGPRGGPPQPRTGEIIDGSTH